MSENVSGIPPSLKDNKLESEVLNILEEIDAPIGPGLVENCLRLPSKGNTGVTLKLNRNKDARKFLDNKKKLKDFDPESVNLPPGTKSYGPGVKKCRIPSTSVLGNGSIRLS